MILLNRDFWKLRTQTAYFFRLELIELITGLPKYGAKVVTQNGQYSYMARDCAAKSSLPTYAFLTSPVFVDGPSLGDQIRLVSSL